MNTTTQKLNRYLAGIFVTAFFGGIVAVAIPVTVNAGSPTTPAEPSCSQRFLSFPAWYRGLLTSDCQIRNPNDPAVGGLSNFIWIIVLNVVELMLQLVGYLAVGFILYGGFRYMTATGSPDQMTKAKKTIMNAVIGLVLAMASIAIVNLVLGAVGL